MPIPEVPGDRDFHVEMCKAVPTLIEQYGLQANPVDMRQGLEGIIEGFDDMRQGKVRGKKVVCKIG